MRTKTAIARHPPYDGEVQLSDRRVGKRNCSEIRAKLSSVIVVRIQKRHVAQESVGLLLYGQLELWIPTLFGRIFFQTFTRDRRPFLMFVPFLRQFVAPGAPVSIRFVGNFGRLPAPNANLFYPVAGFLRPPAESLWFAWFDSYRSLDSCFVSENHLRLCLHGPPITDYWPAFST